MKDLPKKLQQKLEERKASNALRKLDNQNGLIDFSSNDYLGFAKSKTIFQNSHDYLVGHNIIQNGSTGSRLLSGNNQLYNIIESMLASFHNSETALVYNSGYDANVGFFSSIPQRNDIILYDEFIHASIRDGIKMSNAKAYKFKHNNLNDLEQKCQTERSRSPDEIDIYIVTESVFSMDGDSPNLLELSKLCQRFGAHLVVDEAHATGVFGKQGVGMIQDLGLENDVFARIITFGKAMGCHGAVVFGSEKLKQFLINFSRSLIYTTGLPPHSLATIHAAYHELISTSNIYKLKGNIDFFRDEIIINGFQDIFIESYSAIHCCIIPGNERVKLIAKKLQDNGFDVKPILSPTISEGSERLRFCLHSYNSKKEMSEVLRLLSTFV